MRSLIDDTDRIITKFEKVGKKTSNERTFQRLAIAKKRENVQLAQIDIFLQKIVGNCFAASKKVIHKEGLKKPEKWSYAPSYSLYPQKRTVFVYI